MTSSLSSFLFSLLAGGVVLTAIILAVIFVSRTDRLNRNA